MMERDYVVSGSGWNASEMWPRIHTPLLGFPRGHTPCLAQLSSTFHCCCYSGTTSGRMMMEMAVICEGESSVEAQF